MVSLLKNKKKIDFLRSRHVCNCMGAIVYVCVSIAHLNQLTNLHETCAQYSLDVGELCRSLQDFDLWQSIILITIVLSFLRFS